MRPAALQARNAADAVVVVVDDAYHVADGRCRVRVASHLRSARLSSALWLPMSIRVDRGVAAVRSSRRSPRCSSRFRGGRSPTAGSSVPPRSVGLDFWIEVTVFVILDSPSTPRPCQPRYQIGPSPTGMPASSTQPRLCGYRCASPCPHAGLGHPHDRPSVTVSADGPVAHVPIGSPSTAARCAGRCRRTSSSSVYRHPHAVFAHGKAERALAHLHRPGGNARRGTGGPGRGAVRGRSSPALVARRENER